MERQTNNNNSNYRYLKRLDFPLLSGLDLRKLKHSFVINNPIGVI